MSQIMDPYFDRTPTIYGWLVALLGGGALLLFWAMGTATLLTGNGGQIQFLHLEGTWRILYLSYPVVFIGAVLVGAILVLLRRDLLSVAVAAAPVALAVLYYLALVHLR